MGTNSTLGASSLIGAVLATAMVSGLLFSFAHSVLPGLSTLDDRSFLDAFQRIDAAISNVWMRLTFVGSPTLTLAALVLHLPSRNQAVPWLVLALAFVAATVLITVTIHLPLNAAIQVAAPEFADAAHLRSRFDDRWVGWHLVRTVTSIGSLGALCWALFLSGRSAG